MGSGGLMNVPGLVFDGSKVAYSVVGGTFVNSDGSKNESRNADSR
jgi:hypothetical protein